MEKITKNRSRTNNAPLKGRATGRALLMVLAIGLITSGVVLSANANERKKTFITFDVPGAATGGGQGPGQAKNFALVHIKTLIEALLFKKSESPTN